MKITKIDREGLDLIESFEGFSSKPYLCPAKIPTIGYGFTFYPDGKKVTLNDKPITEIEAEKILQTIVQVFEKNVDSFTRDDITQNQFNALVSFAFNLGSKALQNSTLIKLVNNNPNNPKIKNEFMKWVKANGRILQGLVRRRQAEANLYFK